jgi:cytochrome c biogenesis protein CcmG, thiol:disulfide interchange protein DsbE
LREKICLLSLCLLLSACNSTDNAGNTPVISAPPPTTLPMPPFKGTSILNMGWEQTDGKRAIVSDYKGKVLILDFYATWCVPCRDSVPHLIGLQKKFETEGLQVIGLNVGGPGENQLIPGFAKELGIQYPLATPDEDLVRFLMSDSDAIPQTFVFDRQGKLVERFIGFDEEQGRRIDLAVAGALKTSAP